MRHDNQPQLPRQCAVKLGMPDQSDPKLELLTKTADFYRRSLANYEQFARTEIKPRTKKQLEQRLATILKEIDALKPAL